MSLTVVFDFPRPKKIHRHWGMISGNIAFDSSYPTGGELANAANNSISGKFKSCKHIICEQQQGYMFKYDQTNDKIKVYAPLVPGDGGTAGANNTLMVANSQIELSGTGTVGVAYPGVEVPNTANLVALTDVRFIAYGTL